MILLWILNTLINSKISSHIRYDASMISGWLEAKGKILHIHISNKTKRLATEPNLANSPNNIVLVDFRTDVQLGKLTQQHHYGGFLYQRSTWPINPTRSFWWVFVTKFDLAYLPSKVTLSDFASSS